MPATALPLLPLAAPAHRTPQNMSNACVNGLTVDKVLMRRLRLSHCHALAIERHIVPHTIVVMLPACQRTGTLVISDRNNAVEIDLAAADGNRADLKREGRPVV